MYKLYDFPPSGNCYKIKLLFNQLNVEYEKINVDILNAETHTPEFLKINPDARIPVLDHDGKYLAESNAILWYLAEGSSFMPVDKFEQAQVLQWMFFEQFSHEPNIAAPRYWISILKQEDKFKDQIPLKMKLGYAALDVMELHLSKNDFFVGNQYSIADITLYAYTHMAEQGKFDLTGYDKIKAWFKRIESQTGYIDIKAI